MKFDEPVFAPMFEFATAAKAATTADRTVIVLAGYDELTGQDGHVTAFSAPEAEHQKDYAAHIVYDLLSAAATILGEQTGAKLYIQMNDEMREFKMGDVGSVEIGV